MSRIIVKLYFWQKLLLPLINSGNLFYRNGRCGGAMEQKKVLAFPSGKPEAVRRLTGRFSRPLYPGDKINTCIWKKEEGKAVWRVVNVRTGETIITNGIFEYNMP
jgi:hypothetical protein